MRSIAAPGVCTAVLIAGIFIVIAGLTCTEPVVAAKPRRFHLSRVNVPRWQLVAGLAAGIVGVGITRFVPLLVVGPLIVIAGPALWRKPVRRELVMLEALDRWVSALQASQGTGKSIVEAVGATRAQVPAALKGSVEHLIARLDERWTIRDAFCAMADQCDSADVDAVAASLILIAQHGGLGASITLAALSDQIRDRLKAMRQISVEREKPAVVVKQVTAITVGMLAVSVCTSPDYFAPMLTPIGQTIAAVLIALYVACLIQLKRRTQMTARSRILVAASPDRVETHRVHRAEQEAS